MMPFTLAKHESRSLKSTEMPNGTLGQLANLRPWKKGQSGNSLGAARGYRRALKAARDASPEATQKAIECMQDDTAPWSARLKAIEIILHRAWGTEGKVNLDVDRVTSLTIHIVRPDQSPEPTTIDATAKPRPIISIETVPHGSGGDD